MNNVDAYVNVGDVNMRKGPSSSTAILDVLLYGTVVKLTAQNSKWYKVNYNGTVGYVFKKYLTIGSSAPTTPEPKPQGEFTDYEIHLVAALVYLEAPGSTAVGCRAIASIIYNRVKNTSNRFPDDVAGVILQKNQFGNRSLQKLENTVPNKAAKEAAEYVFRTHGSTLPENVFFYRAASMGIEWRDYMVYYATIEGNNFYYGIKYF